MGVKERKEREREQLRQKILSTATEFISTRGHRQLSIRKLAALIEYSPRTIYLYFKNKEALLEEIVEEGFAYTVGKMGAAPREAGLEYFARGHIRMALENPLFYRTVIHLLHERRSPPGPRQREVLSRIDQLLQADHPGKTGEEIATLREIILAALRGFALTLLNEADGAARGRKQELFLRFLLRGVGSES